MKKLNYNFCDIQNTFQNLTNLERVRATIDKDDFINQANNAIEIIGNKKDFTTIQSALSQNPLVFQLVMMEYSYRGKKIVDQAPLREVEADELKNYIKAHADLAKIRNNLKEQRVDLKEMDSNKTDIDITPKSKKASPAEMPNKNPYNTEQKNKASKTF